MAKFLNILLLCVFYILTVSFGEGVLAAGADYGENCDIRNRLCDTKKFLVCDHQTNKCGCRDNVKEKVEDGICKLRWNQPCNSTQDSQDCYGWQICDHKSCTCSPSGLVPNDERVCVLKYNSSCIIGQIGECDYLQNHQCIAGRCRCPQGSTLHSNGKCVATLGSRCSAFAVGSPFLPCDDLMVCLSSGTCACDASLRVEDNGNGKCRKLYGASCANSNFREGMCDAEDRFLACEDGKCVCDRSHREKEQGRDFPCVGGLGSECKSNANCNNDKDLICDTNTGKCQTNDSSRLHLSLGCISAPLILLMIFKKITT